jgi:ankyrin repeat protein
MENEQTFFESIQSGDLATVKKMLSSDPSLLNARSSQGLSPVLTAAYYQEPLIASWLVSQGAPLDIFEACAAGALERVQQILDVDPVLVNNFAPDGFQSLGLAAFFGHETLAGLLLERGAEPDTHSHNGMRVTPLHSAAAGQRLGIARLLVEAGADVNARSAEGFTALHSAAQNGQEELVRLLLEHGADPQASTDSGVKPADLAREKGHEDVVRMLESGAENKKP